MNRISIAAALLAAGFSTAVLAAAPPSAGDASVIEGVGTAKIIAGPVVIAGSAGGKASSYLFYNFEVSGIVEPLPPGPHGVLFISGTYTSAGFLSGSDTGFYSAEVGIQGGSSIGHQYICSNLDQSGCGAFSIVDEPFVFPVFSVINGTAFGTITMSAFAQNEHANGFAYAQVDPTVALSAAFLANNPGAQISGYGAVTPVSMTTGAIPEPASWLLMVMGFGLVAASLRARRRQALGQTLAQTLAA